MIDARNISPSFRRDDGRGLPDCELMVVLSHNAQMTKKQESTSSNMTPTRRGLEVPLVVDMMILGFEKEFWEA